MKYADIYQKNLFSHLKFLQKPSKAFHGIHTLQPNDDVQLPIDLIQIFKDLGYDFIDTDQLSLDDPVQFNQKFKVFFINPKAKPSKLNYDLAYQLGLIIKETQETLPTLNTPQKRTEYLEFSYNFANQFLAPKALLKDLTKQYLTQQQLNPQKLSPDQIQTLSQDLGQQIGADSNLIEHQLKINQIIKK